MKMLPRNQCPSSTRRRSNPLEEVYMRMAEELAKRFDLLALQSAAVITTPDLTPGPRYRLQRQRQGPAKRLRLKPARNCAAFTVSRTR